MKTRDQTKHLSRTSSEQKRTPNMSPARRQQPFKSSSAPPQGPSESIFSGDNGIKPVTLCSRDEDAEEEFYDADDHEHESEGNCRYPGDDSDGTFHGTDDEEEYSSDGYDNAHGAESARVNADSCGNCGGRPYSRTRGRDRSPAAEEFRESRASHRQLQSTSKHPNPPTPGKGQPPAAITKTKPLTPKPAVTPKRRPTTRCKACVWRNTACDGEIPCGTCVAVFRAGKGQWKCYKDPNFKRPKGPAPSKYRVSSSGGSGSRRVPQNTATRIPSPPLSVERNDHPNKRKRSPKDNVDDSRIKRRLTGRTATMSPYIIPPRVLSLRESSVTRRESAKVAVPSPSRFSPAPTNPEGNNGAPDWETPMKVITDRLKRQLQEVRKIAKTYAGNAFLGTAAELEVLDMTRALDKAEKYLSAETEIAECNLRASTKARMVAGNYEGYLEEVGGGL